LVATFYFNKHDQMVKRINISCTKLLHTGTQEQSPIFSVKRNVIFDVFVTNDQENWLHLCLT